LACASKCEHAHQSQRAVKEPDHPCARSLVGPASRYDRLGILVSILTNLVRGSLLVLIVLALIAYIHLQVKPNYH
jgi:hypothetical protein